MKSTIEVKKEKEFLSKETSLTVLKTLLSQNYPARKLILSVFITKMVVTRRTGQWEEEKSD